MKYIILILLFSSCYAPKIIAVECDIIVKGNRISYKNFGKSFPIEDTVIRGMIIRQKTLKH